MAPTSISATLALVATATLFTPACSSTDIPVVDERGTQSQRQDSPADAADSSTTADAPAEADAEAGIACDPNPPATWDFDPGMASSLCTPSRTDCLLCVQCTDTRGHPLVDYVITSYSSSCPCPVAPTICRDAG